MQPEDRDAASLWDMLRAAEAVLEYTRGLSLEQYAGSRLVRRAVERELEILGEAARRLSERFRQEHPSVPWRGIIGLRNFVAHVYDAVDDERIWRVVQNDVPPLVAQLRAVLPPLPSDDAT